MVTYLPCIVGGWVPGVLEEVILFDSPVADVVYFKGFKFLWFDLAEVTNALEIKVSDVVGAEVSNETLDEIISEFEGDERSEVDNGVVAEIVNTEVFKVANDFENGVVDLLGSTKENKQQIC